MAPPLPVNDNECLVDLLTGNLQVGGLHLGVPQNILGVEAVTMSAVESDAGAVHVICDFFRGDLFGEHVPPNVRLTLPRQRCHKLCPCFGMALAAVGMVAEPFIIAKAIRAPGYAVLWRPLFLTNLVRGLGWLPRERLSAQSIPHGEHHNGRLILRSMARV